MDGKRTFGRTVAPYLASVALLVGGCAGEEGQEGPPPETRQAILAETDSVLMELGGEAARRLERGQRWRMISSVGAGLPPPDFPAEALPEPDSRGAALVQAYCVQCHWIPAPQMHSADEWPILMRRMILRARTLHDRMGGPVTRGLVGEILLSGMASAEVPSPEDADTLLAYFQRYAMPAAEPGELGEGEDTDFYRQACGTCHETPSPKAHTGIEWEEVVGRMQSNMAVMSVEPLSDREVERVVSFLRERAAGE